MESGKKVKSAGVTLEEALKLYESARNNKLVPFNVKATDDGRIIDGKFKATEVLKEGDDFFVTVAVFLPTG